MTAQFLDSDRPRTRTDLEFAEIAGEAVIWDARWRRAHRLDAVGTLLWPFLDGSVSIGELIADAAEAWGIPAADARAGVVALVEQVASAGLLEDDTSEDSAGDELPNPKYLADPPSP